MNIKVNKILIRSPNWVGDIVMATPAFRCIRRNFPSSTISIILRPYARLILEGSPWFNHYIDLDTDCSPFGKGVRKYWAVVSKLRQERYDMGIIFPNSFSSGLMFWLAGVKRRIGYIRDARGWLLTDGLKRLKNNSKFVPTYMADYYLKLCYHIGCEEESNQLELFISKEDEKRVGEILHRRNIQPKRHTILINPGAAYGSSKSWTVEGFARTIDMLNVRFDCNVILISGPRDIELADDIEKASIKTVYNLANENITLDLLKPLVKKSSLLITVDSGPRHLAVAFKTPTVVLIGPTDERYTRTKWERGRVIKEEAGCSPCHKKICPADHRCMERISPERVVEACEEVLNMGHLGVEV